MKYLLDSYNNITLLTLIDILQYVSHLKNRYDVAVLLRKLLINVDFKNIKYLLPSLILTD